MASILRNLICLGNVESPEEVAEAIACDEALSEPGVMVMGIGNVKNGGFALDQFFEEHASWIPQRVAVAMQDAASRRAEVAGAS